MARSTSATLGLPDDLRRGDVGRFVERVRAGRPGASSYAILLGLGEIDSVDLLRQVERGLAFDTFTRLQENLALSQAEILEVLQIPQRTLTRRRREGRLRSDESDRLLRAGRVFGGAIELFDGDEVAARRWLASPQTVLGGAVPWDLARTEVGAREVEGAIGRIEHGVVA